MYALRALVFCVHQVVGRKAPTEAEPSPPAYRMKLFAPNPTIAKSRFWYFMHSVSMPCTLHLTCNIHGQHISESVHLNGLCPRFFYDSCTLEEKILGFWHSSLAEL